MMMIMLKPYYKMYMKMIDIINMVVFLESNRDNSNTEA